MLEFLYLVAGFILGIAAVLIYGVSLILRDAPETPDQPPPKTDR